MDDSERSYGYSRDIYHGRRGPGGHYGEPVRGSGAGRFWPDQPHWERSYEVGPERSLGEPQPGDWGPEEEAVRIRGDRRTGPVRPAADHGPAWGRRGERSAGESWTWDVTGPHRGHGPDGYRRPDGRIHEDVCDRLAAHGNLDARRMTVSVEDGEVTLAGTVGDRRSKRLAEAVADTVRGVVDVHNRLRLEGGRSPDEEDGTAS